MMRKLLVAGTAAMLVALFSADTYAQDICGKVKKEVSQDKLSVDLASPFDAADPPPVRATRSFSNNEDARYDNFFLIFRATCELDSIYAKGADGGQVEKDERMLVLEFEDHSKISDDTIKISHDFTDDRLSAIRLAYLPVTDQNAKDLTTKKLVRFIIAGGQVVNIPPDMAAELMQYIRCIKDVK